MMNYSRNDYKTQVKKPIQMDFFENSATWIHFQVNGLGVEWYDLKLPTPNYLLHNKQGYRIAWLVKGSESKYIQELRTRFIQTFKEYEAKNINYTPKDNENAHTSLTIHELKNFNTLQSIKAKAVNLSRVETISDDEAFWAIKFYCEVLIKRDGVPSYSELEQYAYENYTKKCKSTLRAKCRSVFNWYSDRNWKIGRANKKYETKEELMATRKEHMINVNKQKAVDTKRKIINCITGLFANDYKKKNGSWNAIKISKATNISDKSVRKYLKEIENEKTQTTQCN